MNESTFAPRHGRKRPSNIEAREHSFQVQKYTGDDWVTMSRWQKLSDENRLQRHVRALGGSVRLVKDGQRVREWLNGMEVFP